MQRGIIEGDRAKRIIYKRVPLIRRFLRSQAIAKESLNLCGTIIDIPVEGHDSPLRWKLGRACHRKEFMRRACGAPTFMVTLQPDLKPPEGYPEQFHALSLTCRTRSQNRTTLLWVAFGALAARMHVQRFLSRSPATKIPTGYLKAFHCWKNFFFLSSSLLAPPHPPRFGRSNVQHHSVILCNESWRWTRLIMIYRFV